MMHAARGARSPSLPPSATESAAEVEVESAPPRELQVMTPALLTAAQAAEFLGISRSHLCSLVRQGRVGPRAAKLGRCSRWSREELAEWCRAGCPPREKWSRNGHG